jgi:hypothetical protein
VIFGECHPNKAETVRNEDSLTTVDTDADADTADPITRIYEIAVRDTENSALIAMRGIVGCRLIDRHLRSRVWQTDLKIRQSPCDQLQLAATNFRVFQN